MEARPRRDRGVELIATFLAVVTFLCICQAVKTAWSMSTVILGLSARSAVPLIRVLYQATSYLSTTVGIVLGVAGSLLLYRRLRWGTAPWIRGRQP